MWVYLTNKVDRNVNLNKIKNALTLCKKSFIHLFIPGNRQCLVRYINKKTHFGSSVVDKYRSFERYNKDHMEIVHFIHEDIQHEKEGRQHEEDKLLNIE